jgi:hypothetical protein
MTTKRGQQFDERTNIGAQPNSQGTLFRVTQRSRDVVGPKGFSPARQDHVREVLHGVQNRYKDGGPPDLREGTPGIYASELHGQEPPKAENHRLTPEGMGQRASNARAIQDMVSRSTAPLTKDPDGRQTIIATGQSMSEDLARQGAGGTYHRPGNSAGGFDQSAHRIRLSTESAKNWRNKDGAYSTTLLHELGHRESQVTGRSSSAYDTPARRGEEEAYADDHSVLHTKQFGGRAAVTHEGTYEPNRQQTNNSPQGYYEFKDSYKDHRTTPMEEPRPSQAEIDRKYWNQPDHHVRGQTALLHKTRRGGHTWDGQDDPTKPPKPLSARWDYNEEITDQARDVDHDHVDHTWMPKR